MLSFALNHMAVPSVTYVALMHMAKRLNCAGVEFRNDFSHRLLFEGDAPEKVKALSEELGVPLLALSEVKMFNRWSDQKSDEAEQLMKIAVKAGIPAVSLIPANDGKGLGNGERQANLRLALRELKPMLESYKLIGNVEPLGFPSSSVRDKVETIEAIEAVGGKARFKLVHDSFHHVLAGGGAIYPEYTGIVHISGVIDQTPAIEALEDGHRVLVEADDRLGTIAQIQAFREAHWNGVYSFEPFSKDIHSHPDPEAALRVSIEFIRSHINAQAA